MVARIAPKCFVTPTLPVLLYVNNYIQGDAVRLWCYAAFDRIKVLGLGYGRNNEELGLLDWSNQEASKFLLEFKLVLHFTRKQTNFHLTFAEENCAMRGRHYKYSYSCTVAASYFIRSHVWFWDVSVKNDEDRQTKAKMWKWRSESHMAANLELHVATSAARYPQATNYLSILTTKLKSRGTKERDRQSGVETREKRCWIRCYKTK